MYLNNNKYSKRFINIFNKGPVLGNDMQTSPPLPEKEQL